MLNYLVSKFSSMKKLNRKLLGVGLIVLFFSVSLIFLVRAQIMEEGAFFRIDSASTTPVGAKTQDGKPLYIVNRSGQDFFVPNKTMTEFAAFKEGSPNHISVSVCGDGVCGEGETAVNCDDDCSASKTPVGCGDGICAISFPFGCIVGALATLAP